MKLKTPWVKVATLEFKIFEENIIKIVKKKNINCLLLF